MGEVNQAKCDLIEGYLKQYGWNFNRTDQMGKWITMIRSEVSLHELIIVVNEWWILFIINPFVVGPKDEVCQRRLYKHLLCLNPDYCGMKYSLTLEGDVLISVEMPYDTPDFFQYQEFTQALDVIFYHCNKHYPELIQLAVNPNAPSRYLDPPPPKAGSGTDVDLS